MATLAFDVYGTLIDTHAVVTALGSMIGDKAQMFSHAWREQQLEYAFRRGLMRNYRPFSVCTRDALNHTCERFSVHLSEAQRDELMVIYKVLPAFDDARAALPELRAAGHRLFAFSNGTAEAVDGLLTHAGIRGEFEDVVSVDDIRSFKPDPAVYAHFLRSSGSTTEQAWLISGNPFDVLGAMSAGMRAAWVRRTENQPWDDWGEAPTATVASIGELAKVIESGES